MPNETGSENTGYKARAPRFPIQTPLRYRESGTTHWHQGRTINISRTGILFRAEQELHLHSLLEMRLVFPSEITGKSVPTTVACWGPVVRSHPLEFPETTPALAVKIRNHRFLQNAHAGR